MSFSRGHVKASKLKAEQVMQLRERYAAGWTQGRLSREYGVSVGQIGRIVRGESWQQFPVIASEAELAEGALLSQQRLLRMLAADPPPNDPGLAERLMREAQAVRDRDRGAERALDELAQPAEGTSGEK